MAAAYACDCMWLLHMHPLPAQAALGEAGIGAEFYSGCLLCSGHVLVRRGGDEGQLLLEGPLGEEYYRIRNIVYGQYNVC